MGNAQSSSSSAAPSRCCGANKQIAVQAAREAAYQSAEEAVRAGNSAKVDRLLARTGAASEWRKHEQTAFDGEPRLLRLAVELHPTRKRLIKAILRNGGTGNMAWRNPEKYGRTLLHEAAANSAVPASTLRVLLSTRPVNKRVFVCTTDQLGFTPLALALAARDFGVHGPAKLVPLSSPGEQAAPRPADADEAAAEGGADHQRDGDEEEKGQEEEEEGPARRGDVSRLGPARAPRIMLVLDDVIDPAPAHHAAERASWPSGRSTSDESGLSGASAGEEEGAEGAAVAGRPVRLRPVGALPSTPPHATGDSAASSSAVEVREASVESAASTSISSSASGGGEVAAARAFSLTALERLPERVRVLHLLLRYGAAVDTVTRGNWNLLHISARFAPEALALLLMSRCAGADAGVAAPVLRSPAFLNAQLDDPYGKPTPLHLAAANGHIVAVRALLASGADTTVKDAFGRTAGEVARRALSMRGLHPYNSLAPPSIAGHSNGSSILHRIFDELRARMAAEASGQAAEASGQAAEASGQAAEASGQAAEASGQAAEASGQGGVAVDDGEAAVVAELAGCPLQVLLDASEERRAEQQTLKQTSPVADGDQEGSAEGGEEEEEVPAWQRQAAQLPGWDSPHMRSLREVIATFKALEGGLRPRFPVACSCEHALAAERLAGAAPAGRVESTTALVTVQELQDTGSEETGASADEEADEPARSKRHASVSAAVLPEALATEKGATG